MKDRWVRIARGCLCGVASASEGGDYSDEGVRVAEKGKGCGIIMSYLGSSSLRCRLRGERVNAGASTPMLHEVSVIQVFVAAGKGIKERVSLKSKVVQVDSRK